MNSNDNNNNNGFSSLSIFRVADEEIGKLKNDRIHYTYLNCPKNTNNDSKNKKKDIYQSYQINHKKQIYENKSKSKEKEKNNRNRSAAKSNNYSFVGSSGEGEQKYSNKRIILKTRNASKEKDKNLVSKINVHTYKKKVRKKRNIEYIDRIIIDLVNNDDDNDNNKDNNKDNNTIKTESNYNLRENSFKKNMTNNINEKNNNYEKLINTENNLSDKYDIQNAMNMIENRWKNICVESQESTITILSDGIKYAINMIENRWKNNCVESKELNLPLVSNQVFRKKKEIEDIIKNKKNITK